MRTPSLARRVVLASLGVLALLLVVVGVGVDLALGAVLKGEQRQRLESVAGFATSLEGLSDRSLADRLTMGDVDARIRYSSGARDLVGVPRPPAPGARPAPPRLPSGAARADVTVTERGDRMTAVRAIRPGVELVLSSDSRGIDAALMRYRVVMTAASALALALAGALLPVVLRRAMRPLDALTRAASETALGGRGRRLDPRDTATDLGRAARQFDAMLEELEGAERRASEPADRLARFLSDASHELRTPLAGVSGGAERLIREPLDPEQRDHIAVQLVRESRRAARLVDDLLLVSRLGELGLSTADVDVRGVLEETAERARQRPAAPVVEVRGRDVVVSGDRVRLEQVLANLVANAGAAGAGRVRLALARQGAAAVVRVSDDGPGIPVGARERVFERLVRLDPSRSAAAGGAGLGLPIARGLAEAHGGSLQVVDRRDGDLSGAVLELRLPAASAAPESSVTPPDAATDAARRVPA